MENVEKRSPRWFQVGLVASLVLAIFFKPWVGRTILHPFDGSERVGEGLLALFFAGLAWLSWQQRKRPMMAFAALFAVLALGDAIAG